MKDDIYLLKKWLSRYLSNYSEKSEPIFAIEVLDLSNKEIKIIPPQISLLSKLRVLNLMNNPIQELPEEFEDLESLEIIDVRNTPLAGTHVDNLPNSVYGVVSDQETADLVYGKKPEQYFLPYYSAGIVDSNLIILLFRHLYDLKISAPHQKQTIYQIMQEKSPQSLVEKFGHYIDKRDKSQGIYFEKEDKDKILEFMYSTSGDPFFKVESYQELVSEVVKKLSE